MRLIFARNFLQLSCDRQKVLFSILLLFAVWPTGCSTCFTFVSNPSTGTINISAGDGRPACGLTPAHGTVRLMVERVPLCSSCPESSPRIRHIFVSIQGIEVHESLMPADGSPEWQELAPQLATQPLQVDLVRGIDGQDEREPLAEIVTAPAGIYHQVRVRFADDVHAKDPRQGESGCRDAGSNCVVMSDDTVRPLLFGTASPELRITPERIAAGSLLILPDVGSNLIIEMKPVWSWVLSESGDVRQIPRLIGNARVERVGLKEQGTPQ